MPCGKTLLRRQVGSSPNEGNGYTLTNKGEGMETNMMIMLGVGAVILLAIIYYAFFSK